VANKLIIDPEALARIRAAIAALEEKPEPTPSAAEPMPERVRRLWHHQERIVPHWELESAEEREQREFFEKAGVHWP
jgi:hypothetical protein